jgi:enoyl-CoA hydratase/carnithine racemase
VSTQGGHYFSNGIALNTIESSPSPPHETWNNINAIDDIVEFLISDVSPERSSFMASERPLCERGILTMACLRGNAAAGGVALAAACDVVVGARGVVLNPAYRAMGLHGSEFHSYVHT